MPTKKQIMENVNSNMVQTSKIVANNTVQWLDKDNVEHIRFHFTDVIINDGKKIILNSNGHKTKTTRERLNDFQPVVNISQKNSVWYCNTIHHKDVIFYDGITFDVEGHLLSENKENLEKEYKDLNKKIKTYCDGLKALEELPKPSTGDCFYCQFDPNFGKHNIDHLLSHLEEKYFMGSLIVKALTESGYRKDQIAYVWGIRDIVVRSVRSYFKKHLGLCK